MLSLGKTLNDIKKIEVKRKYVYTYFKCGRTIRSPKEDTVISMSVNFPVPLRNPFTT